MKRLFVFVLLLLQFSPFGRAALVFDKTTITLDLDKQVPHVDVEYPFKNTGESIVTVADITTSCGCMVASLDKKTFAPGDANTLKVRFDIGERQGPQSRLITVPTDAGVHELTLNVNVPMRSVILPRLLLFQAPNLGDQSVTVTYYQDLPVTLLGLTSTDPAFTVTSSVEKEGAAFKLTAHLVDPAPSIAARSTVLVRSQSAAGVVSTDTFYLRYGPQSRHSIAPAPAPSATPAASVELAR